MLSKDEQPSEKSGTSEGKPRTPLPQTARPGGGSRKTGRRVFLKLAALGGVGTAIIPYIPYGAYLTQGAQTLSAEKQRLILSDGAVANINRFPLNTSQVIVYPRTGDPAQDAEPFRRFQLIRLPPPEGEARDASAFRCYSMICVHLWCLWNYWSDSETAPCPCHGSTYRLADGLAIAGPAAVQTAPNNALPSLDLEVDDEGDIWIRPPDWTVDRNGIVGYGRWIPGVTKKP